MEKTFAMTMLEAANSTSSSKSKKRNMKFPRTTEMSLLKYVMNCVLLQLLLDTKYSKAGLKRWHVQHHHYGRGSIGGMFEDHIYLGHLGTMDYLDATCRNRVTKVGNQLVHAARDDTTMMMFQETRVPLFEQNLHKSTGRAANQVIRESRDRGQQLQTAQELFNIRNDPHAILLQAKETLYPASRIPI